MTYVELDPDVFFEKDDDGYFQNINCGPTIDDGRSMLVVEYWLEMDASNEMKDDGLNWAVSKTSMDFHLFECAITSKAA